MGTTDSDLSDSEAALRALDAFVMDNGDLDKLEAATSQFNLFEAVGMVRAEIRHSNFLAFLLNPIQNHGLGDLFLKRLLQRTLTQTGRDLAGLSPVHLDMLDLSGVVVRREWNNTDILCVKNDILEGNRLAILIENKIDSDERLGQLKNYLQTVNLHYPTHRAIPLYLTPEGNEPSDERYIPIDYSLIADTLADVLDARRSVMGADVFTVINHYIQMLRRHIVIDSEVGKLARQIYEKHPKALEIIFEHRPDARAEWAEKLQELVKAETQLELDQCSSTYIRFIPKIWREIPALNRGAHWTSSKRILLFEFKNFAPEKLSLDLVMGPCESGAESVRENLFRFSQTCEELKPISKKLPAKHAVVWRHPFLSEGDFQESEAQDLLNKVGREWQSFVADTLPNFIKLVKEIVF